MATTTTIILSSGRWVKVPYGVDPDHYRKLKEAELASTPQCKAKPKRKASRSTRSYNSKRTNYAARTLSPFSTGMLAVARRLDELKEVSNV